MLPMAVTAALVGHVGRGAGTEGCVHRGRGEPTSRESGWWGRWVGGPGRGGLCGMSCEGKGVDAPGLPSKTVYDKVLAICAAFL